MTYDRISAVRYAEKWAFERNPAYYNFDDLGGDCTNFVSQCLFTGCNEMNFTPVFGWYYENLNNRTPSWTGVEFLHNFLVSNRGSGPRAKLIPLIKAQIGDVIQLSFDGLTYSHTLFITSLGLIPFRGNIGVASHTLDSFNRPLSSYIYLKSRVLHIYDVEETMLD